MVLPVGIRARKNLFYKDFAGSGFLVESIKNRHFCENGVVFEACGDLVERTHFTVYSMKIKNEKRTMVL